MHVYFWDIRLGGFMLASARSVLRREMSGRNKAGAILAMLTCPCHAPVIIFLLAGTAVGSFLAAIRAYLYLAFAMSFMVGLWFMFRRSATSCEIPRAAEPAEHGEHQSV